VKKDILGDIASWAALNVLFFLLLGEQFNWLLFPIFSAISIGLLSLLMYVFKRKRNIHGT
jgi:ABC-type Fe3+-siderophore transport system permease subunit